MTALPTTPHYVLDRAKETPDAPAHLVKEAGQWVASTWGDYGRQVERAGLALMEMGVGVGDTVCLLGFNRPAWVIFDVAAMAVGAAPAGIYTTCSAVEIQYIARHAGAKVVLVEDQDKLDKVASQASKLPN
ncbi:MAG: AMP-binding protein, partial [Deltaproteobacteria bacterium]|nr:AMP-binding protein [Deltaproteobacteria bacterium]